MKVWLRVLLLGVMGVSIFSFSWFLYGATGHFQGGMDLMETAVLIGVGIPVLLSAGLPVVLFMKKWQPAAEGDYVRISVGVALSLILSAVLIDSISTYGWTEH